MNYIELFAGCGGLSLGLKSEGFELLMANEISPMASETFAFNFFNEDLTLNSPKKTLWLSSQFPLTEMHKRLREDPREYPQKNGFSELVISDFLSGNLIVGNIVHLNKWLEKYDSEIKKVIEQKQVDLISGGPPCQSFSMAGLRELNNSRNTLPWEFIKFVDKLQPKFVLLENVSGILRAFKDNDKKYFAWFEVAKSFAQINYIPMCIHTNAKFVGVAQNRPRFILIAVQFETFKKLYQNFNSFEKELFKKPKLLIEKTINKNKISIDEFEYIDIHKEVNHTLLENSFLKPLISNFNQFNSVSDAIDDLSNKDSEKSKYVNLINNNYVISELANHELRNNSQLVKRRFRIYQIQKELSASSSKLVKEILKGNVDELSKNAFNEINSFEFLLENNTFGNFQNKDELIAFLERHKTKKQTQKALIADEPAPATLSIPDDSCHYNKDELRTLTVRELARIQSFPDSFEFRSKVTTGGKMRRFEVPQYTQVGNAVPPLLGKALGKVIKNLLAML